MDLTATDQWIWNKDISSYVRFGAYGISISVFEFFAGTAQVCLRIIAGQLRFRVSLTGSEMGTGV